MGSPQRFKLPNRAFCWSICPWEPPSLVRAMVSTAGTRQSCCAGAKRCPVHTRVSLIRISQHVVSAIPTWLFCPCQGCASSSSRLEHPCPALCWSPAGAELLPALTGSRAQNCSGSLAGARPHSSAQPALPAPREAAHAGVMELLLLLPGAL